MVLEVRALTYEFWGNIIIQSVPWRSQSLVGTNHRPVLILSGHDSLGGTANFNSIQGWWQWWVKLSCQKGSFCLAPEYRSRMEFQGGRLYPEVATKRTFRKPMKCPVMYLLSWTGPSMSRCSLGPGFNNPELLKASVRWSAELLWIRRFCNWIKPKRSSDTVFFFSCMTFFIKHYKML